MVSAAPGEAGVTRRPARRASRSIPICDDAGVHEDHIRSARRRLWLVTAGGLLVLSCTLAAVVFPIAWLLGAAANPLGAELGYGWGLTAWSLWVSAAIAAVFAVVAFGWALVRAERSALEFVRAWPGPDSSPIPPPAMPEGIVDRVQKTTDVLALATGARAPRVAVVIDDVPNCLTVGRTPTTAWIVVTTGLVDTLEHRELEAVLAYEIGRVVELEVSLDTVVYALTNRAFEVWTAAFSDFDEVALLLIPLAVLAAPLFLASIGLRAAVLRSRARLADGLAVRYCRDPGALARALRKILADAEQVRRGDPANAHLWLEYPHSRASRWMLRTHQILPRRIARLEQLAGAGSPPP